MANKRNELKRPNPGAAASPVIGSNGVHTEPGDNTKYALSLIDLAQDTEFLAEACKGKSTMEELLELRRYPLDKKDVISMAKRFVGYLAFCAMNDERITNKMAYARIGISKDDVYHWEHELSRTEKHSRFIKVVQEFCSAAREQMGADGKLSPVTLIWWQKQYDHYTDNTTVTLVNGSALGEDRDHDSIAAQYRQIVDELPDMKKTEG